ncbi:MAG: amino acid permease [Gammaproteobacteria bacterium]|nr:amino acid permease [Gammaproteobacteria bacterium]
MSLFRRKAVVAHDHGGDRLHAVLGPWDLTLLGIGCIIGAGVFVLTGITAANHAGPAVALSFAVAAVACTLTALAYAELAAMMGGSGGAYGYSYAAFGELPAWLVGWNLLLEYALAVSAVAVGWSGYVNDAMIGLGLALPESLIAPPAHGGIVNLPAVLVIAVLGCVLAAGVQGSARFNALIVAIKVTVIGIFLVAAAGKVDPANWVPFMPFGWSGVMTGAALIFFAYIGFDAVATAAEEARNPQRDMPIGIIASLVVCTILYVLVGLGVTGLVHYSELNVPSPVASAMLAAGYKWAAIVVAVGAIAGLTSVMLVCYYAQTRVLFAMARDGLIPDAMATLHPRRRTPTRLIVLSGLVMAAVAGFVPLEQIAQLVNIGTLSAFAFVCAGVLVLRYTHPEMQRPFRTPGAPVTTVLGVAACVYLMINLPGTTWMRFAVWIAVGLLIYFLYSRRASRLAAAA